MATKQTITDKIQEAVTVFFLAAGPALGAAVAIVWIVGLVMGLVAVATR